MKRFVIVGLGNFGAAVAEVLQAIGHDVAALDRDPDRVDNIARRRRGRRGREHGAGHRGERHDHAVPSRPGGAGDLRERSSRRSTPA